MNSGLEVLQNAVPRREFLKLLGFLPLARQARRAEPVLQAAALDHFNIRVSDVAKSTAFYHKLFGGELLRVSSVPANPTSPPGEAFYLRTGESYLVISRAFAKSPPGLDHICMGIRDYDAERTKMKLEQNGFAPERWNDDLWVRDPDGLLIQLRSPGGWGRLSATRGALPAPPEITAHDVPGFTPTSIIEISLAVADLNRSGSFYGGLFGSETESFVSNRVRDVKIGDVVLKLLPPATPSGASAGPRLDHFGVAVKDFAADSARRALRERGIDPYDRNHTGQVYFRDPDGIQVQLASPALPR
jgi:catechol 2,3-dioxygenase-like lactoylglutathione lyase family enzyme